MKRFVTGFAVGLFTFGLLNLVAHFILSSPMGRSDRAIYWGYPFLVWLGGGLPRIEGDINYASLSCDIALAGLCGIALGVVLKRKARDEIN